MISALGRAPRAFDAVMFRLRYLKLAQKRLFSRGSRGASVFGQAFRAGNALGPDVWIKHSRAARGYQRLLGTAPSAAHSSGAFRAFRTQQYNFFPSPLFLVIPPKILSCFFRK